MSGGPDAVCREDRHLCLCTQAPCSTTQRVNHKGWAALRSRASRPPKLQANAPRSCSSGTVKHKDAGRNGLTSVNCPCFAFSSMHTSPRQKPELAYRTELGLMYKSRIESFIDSRHCSSQTGKIRLVLTSPPFPLNRKKKYGNLNGQDYVDWLSGLAEPLKRLLHPKGSIVLEMGNAWEPGQPVMSTLALEALLAFLKAGDLKLCQQFICYNPARLPSPAQWVNVERIRLKDAYTHVWWMSPTERPNADNTKVLKPYSEAMLKLLESKKYNSGKRPSEHNIGKTSFLKRNGGAIPSSVLTFSNTINHDSYLRYCRANSIQVHPARMPSGLAEFFIRFLTKRGDLVLDPFAGSNTTGAAAARLQRKWIAVEADDVYIQGSRGRFPNLIQQRTVA